MSFHATTLEAGTGVPHHQLPATLGKRDNKATCSTTLGAWSCAAGRKNEPQSMSVAKTTGHATKLLTTCPSQSPQPYKRHLHCTCDFPHEDGRGWTVATLQSVSSAGLLEAVLLFVRELERMSSRARKQCGPAWTEVSDAAQAGRTTSCASPCQIQQCVSASREGTSPICVWVRTISTHTAREEMPKKRSTQRHNPMHAGAAGTNDAAASASSSSDASRDGAQPTSQVPPNTWFCGASTSASRTQSARGQQTLSSTWHRF